jgi:hypothetical protein
VQQAENYDRLAALLTECGVDQVCVYERHQRTVLPL